MLGLLGMLRGFYLKERDSEWSLTSFLLTNATSKAIEGILRKGFLSLL